MQYKFVCCYCNEMLLCADEGNIKAHWHIWSETYYSIADSIAIHAWFDKLNGLEAKFRKSNIHIKC